MHHASPDRFTARGAASSTSTPPAESPDGLRSPFAPSPLQRRIRHTRLFSTLTSPVIPGAPSAFAGAALTTPATTPTQHAHGGSGGTAMTTPRLSTAGETVAPRTVLTTGSSSGGGSHHYPAPSWLPTRLTSPYCVLSAAGVQEDFYTSALSWGTDQMALALPHDLVLFHPSRPRQSSSTARVADAPPNGASSAAAAAFRCVSRRATAVAMSRAQEVSCFLGLSNGAVELYEGKGDGTLPCSVAFAMPEPPTDYLGSLLGTGSAAPASVRAANAFSLLSASVSSVTCIGTSGRHPWLAAAATSACGLLTLDARQVQPALRFGRTESHTMSAASSTESGLCGSALPSPLSKASSLSSSIAPAQLDGAPLSRLQRAAAFLRQHDRLCSVSWNATGSLVATGSSSGIVRVWSLSAPQRPLHAFLVDPECTVKALCFHPERPYELLVGASAGVAGLRTYDLSSAAPVLTSCGMTAAAVTQALYDPAGSYAVTCAGAPTDLAEPLSSAAGANTTAAAAAAAAAGSSASYSPLSSLHPSPRVRGRPEANSPSAGSVLMDRSPHWHLPASPAHSGRGGAGSVAALLGDTWDDMDDVEDGSSPFSGDSDAHGSLLPTPTAGAGGASMRAHAAAAVAHRSPPNALVVWRCGGRRRDTYLREALLREEEGAGDGRRGRLSGDDNDDDDGAEEHPLELTQPFDDDAGMEGGGDGGCTRAASVGKWRSGRAPSALRDDKGGSDGGVLGDDHFGSSWASDGVQTEWLPMTALPGHRARPLLMCAPFAQSSFAGCFASVAAGEDGTIRFWRLFDTNSDASHWQHRRLAQQRSATTQADADLFATPVLR